MCGLAGIVLFKNIDYKNEVAINDVNEATLDKMLNLISYRGPDASNKHRGENHIFGHNRLSIIDLNEASNQPMVSENRYVIVFNGEIYNFKNLKKLLLKKGYEFYTNSDTEVILNGYREWGDKTWEKLDGMFAIAIYDIHLKELSLVRDRIGEKPLYYTRIDDVIYFSSEIKQLLEVDEYKKEIDDESINEYLQFQFALKNKTFFKNIYKVLPGERIKINCQQTITAKYWSIDDFHVNNNSNISKLKDEIKSAVNNAVKTRLNADVEIGAYLSGGIDSTITSSIASKEKKNLNTFTYTSRKFKEIDESVAAKQTSKLLKTNHHEIDGSEFDLLEHWRKAIFHMDEPTVGFSLISQMTISSEVSKRVKVVVGGQGGDELFCGYGWYDYLYFFTPHDNNYRYWINGFRILYNKVKIFDYKFLFNLVKFKYKFRKDISSLYQNIWSGYTCSELVKTNKIYFPKFESIDEIRRFEIKYWLQGLLHVEDRASMASSIESRTPFLNHELVQIAIQIPFEYLIDGRKNKKLLIDSFADIIPNHIHNNGIKKGYPSPFGQWIDRGDISLYIEAILNNKKSFIFEFLDFDKVNGKKLSLRELWMIISLQIWYEIYFNAMCDAE